MAKTVTVEIDEQGDVSIDLKGFKGKGCKAVADAFSVMGKVTKETTKPEYNDGPGAGNTVTACR